MQVEKARLDDFFKSFKQVKRGFRLGQAFHVYFSLEKCHQDKHLWDKLYQLDGDEAKEFIRTFIETSGG